MRAYQPAPWLTHSGFFFSTSAVRNLFQLNHAATEAPAEQIPHLRPNFLGYLNI
jgi:hypothetical protein